MLQKKGIALLVTLFFIMLITVSIGIGFSYIHDASKSIKSEQKLLQATMIVNDVIEILKATPELKDINSTEDLAYLFNATPPMAIKQQGLDILITLKSARSKINPNTLKDSNGTKKMESFKLFLQNHMINTQYGDMMNDLLQGIQSNDAYITDIFDEHPQLYRDGIVSYEQLDLLNDIYKQKYHTNDIDKVDMQEIFYVSQDTSYSIDANFATSLIWQVILGCSRDRADQLVSDGSSYTKIDDLYSVLDDDEKKLVRQFNVGVNQKILDVKIEINDKENRSFIRFEYNVDNSGGSNFVFKI